MFRDKEISILSEDGHLDDNGLWINDDAFILGTISASVQPYNKALAYRDYSFNEDVQYRVFCEPEPSIKLGVSIAYLEPFQVTETIFKVVKITPWNNHWEVLLSV